ncbi:MAG TPA: alpha/beta fold hydrolase [Acetobacteraceae bacterium]|nr:alpha/beta fold hydrolase [Acetobacteraceae bacterium]
MLRHRFSALLLIVPLLLGACVAHLVPEGPLVEAPTETARAFVLPDGTALKYRVWEPAGEVRAIVLALHGMNDSRDAWEFPADAFTAAGIEIISPDQRGFGSTPQRGYWAGTSTMVDDARRMAMLVRAAHPHTPLILMGESMGGAVLMCLAASSNPPPVDGYVLVAPAVWGRAEMNVFERVGLWVAANALPGFTLTGQIAKVTASDNRKAIERLSTDPLTIHHTRMDAVNGLVNLMDAAQAAAPWVRGPALFLYGGKDELIPKRATVAAWHSLPRGMREAYYPGAYHLMLRDIGRAVPIADVIAWIFDHRAPLPSGADNAAEMWLAEQS